QGDFTDWVDSSGNLIPVFDPDTLRANPNFNPSQPEGPQNLPYLRDQFMGCDGKSPNIICSSDPRLQNSLAQTWIKYLPAPTFPGPLHNYVTPVAIPGNQFGTLYHLDLRIDHYIGDKDRASY